MPTGDPFFDPTGSGTATIGLNRSQHSDTYGVREQINQITAFMDGSNVYGSDYTRAAALRTFSGGQLKTSAGNLLPFNTPGLANAGGTSDTLFLAGDVRANENAALTAMHTVWLREHNRIAARIATANPYASDEAIYQTARREVITELQVITYKEFLPALLGPAALEPYGGYDAAVNPGISNEFSTAAFRLGHSLLSPVLQRRDANGAVAASGNLALQNAFFNPSQVSQYGIDSLLRGAAGQRAQELDVHIVDDLRNFLFGQPGAGGFDLASLNIQRGRDHGLAGFNQTRQALGLSKVTSFSQISSDPATAATLERLYGNVDNVDLWVAGLAEDHTAGGSVGETFTAIIADQFRRLRAGDANWYRQFYSEARSAQFERTTLADVIARNTGVAGLQKNLFFVPSVMTYRLADTGVNNIRIRTAGSDLLIVDVGRHVVERRSLAEVNRLLITGAATADNRITLDIADADVAAGSALRGVTIDLGPDGDNSLTVLGSNGDDVMTASRGLVRLGGLWVAHSGLDHLMLRGGSGDDLMTVGDSGVRDTKMFGDAGNDVMVGKAGDDIFYGGLGDDLLIGGAGNDRLFGGAGNDRIYGGPGDDRLIGGAGDDTLDGGPGRNIFDKPPAAARLAAAPALNWSPLAMSKKVVAHLGSLLG